MDSKLIPKDLEKPVENAANGINDLQTWLPFVDAFRTLCRNPEPQFKALLVEIQEVNYLFASNAKVQGLAYGS